MLLHGDGSNRQLSKVLPPSSVLSVIFDKQHRHHHRNSDTSSQTSNDVSNIDGTVLPPVPDHKPKSFVYTMLNPRSKARQAAVFKWFITGVIVVDLIVFVVSTEPGLDKYQRETFYMWEGITSSIFLLEYVTWLVVVTEAQKYYDQGPLWGRICYLKTLPALIDLLATLPFFLEFLTRFELPTLTYLRAFRLLRILKTSSGFAAATNSVYRVIYYNQQILNVAFLICIFLVLFTALLMYYLRPRDPELSQQFQSLGSTIYLSTLMLTGQGGPDGDIPWYTKGIVLVTGVFSIGMFAIPASMLTWGFEAEAQRMASLNYSRRYNQRAPGNEIKSDNWSYSSCDYLSDEEYRKIITGEGGDEGHVDKDKAAREAFCMADIDGSGNISLREYLAWSRQQAVAAEGTRTPTLHELSLSLSKMERRIEENSQKLDRITRLRLGQSA